MKTTLEIPDALFRRVKATAAERGQSLKEFVTEALQLQLARTAAARATGEPPWMAHFGGLKHLSKETRRVQQRIDAMFGQVDEEQWT